jgi:hypothetical protein
VAPGIILTGILELPIVAASIQATRISISDFVVPSHLSRQKQVIRDKKWRGTGEGFSSIASLSLENYIVRKPFTRVLV